MEKNPNIQIEKWRLQLLLGQPTRRAELRTQLTEIFERNSNAPETVNDLAWTVYEAGNKGTLADTEIFRITREAAQIAVRRVSGATKGYTLDTIAHLLDLESDLAGAIQAQQDALLFVETSADKEPLVKFMKELKAKQK